jgi:hypothetical protein
MDDGDAITGQLHVELDAVGAIVDGAAERCDRILRRRRRRAPMRDHQR